MSCPECGCTLWSHRQSDTSLSIKKALRYFTPNKKDEEIQLLKDRINELEKPENEYKEMLEFISSRDLVVENKKLVEVVKFYAPKNEWHYWQPEGEKDTATHTSKITNDAGKRAREVLKELEVEV